MTKDKLIKNIFNMGVLTAIVAVACPDISWAANIGGSLNSFRTSDVTALPPLVNGIAFVGGAVLGISGALKLKAHAENPAQEKLAPGVARLLAGGAIASLPVIVRTAFDTLHMNDEITFRTISNIT